MCGIIAGKGGLGLNRKILAGLQSLEYRGYDSWGVAGVTESAEYQILRDVGQVGQVEISSLVEAGLKDLTVALGHTRWATTGEVNLKNTHPHQSQSGRLVLAQNGVFENYLEIKNELSSHGFKFESTTDTEVLVNLIEFYTDELDLPQAIAAAFKRVEGRNSIVLLDRVSGYLYGVRQGSPLIVGFGEYDNEYFIASDLPAFAPYSKRISYLDDQELVEISQQLKFFNLADLSLVQKRKIKLDLQQKKESLGTYSHYMIKEINDQKKTLRLAIDQDSKKIEEVVALIKKAKGVFAVGCGTAGNVSLIGTYLFSQIANRHLNFVAASEFGQFKNFLKPETLMIVTSQSGETADVLEAMAVAKSKGAKVVALVNVEYSSIAQAADYPFYLQAGVEKAVASTKASSSQIAIYILLAYAANNQLDLGRRVLIEASGLVNDLLNPRYEQRLKTLAGRLSLHDHLYFIGRGVFYPLALEGALKSKEVSYIHAEGLAAGELKHGSIALITKGVPVIVLVPPDDQGETLINAEEIKSRGGYIIGVAAENAPVFDYFIKVPAAGSASVLTSLVPLQILAYYLAINRGVNPDKPRNLAKSVTVK